MRRAHAIYLTLLSSFAGGCAFISPVWEFSASGNDERDGGVMDGGRTDGGRTDAGATDGGTSDGDVSVDDGGAVGWDVCRPCIVENDVGCPAGHGCYVGTPGGTECTVCVERTGLDADLGEACVTGPDCRQGLDCIAFRCRTFCDQADECAADQVCYEPASTSPTGWCLGRDCDPMDTSTCPAGQACTLVGGAIDPRSNTVCLPAGTGAPGESCDRSCQPGSICYGGRCLSFCSEADPSCSAGQSCVIIGDLGGTFVGACFPQCTTDSQCFSSWVCETTELMVCVPP